MGEWGTTAPHPDKDEVVRPTVTFEDLVRDAGQRTTEAVGIEDQFLEDVVTRCFRRVPEIHRTIPKAACGPVGDVGTWRPGRDSVVSHGGTHLAASPGLLKGRNCALSLAGRRRRPVPWSVGCARNPRVPT